MTTSHGEQTDRTGEGEFVLPRGLTAEPEVLTVPRLLEVIRLAPIGVGIVDMKGFTVMTNDHLRRMLGYSAGEFAAMPFDRFTHPDDVARNARLFDRMVSGDLDSFELEKRFIHRDGEVIWGRLLVSLLREGGDEPSLAIGLLTDITEERRLRTELERMAYHDDLTRLANRRSFEERLERRITHSTHGPDTPAAVLFIDVDDLKAVNDELGHAGGDDALRQLGDRLTAAIRPTDTAARIGGDEFAVLLDSVTDLTDASNIAGRLAVVLRAPMRIGGAERSLTVSVGVATVDVDSTVHRVLAEADSAMYRAKRAGKDGVAVGAGG